MTTMASQITSLTIVYPTVYSDADQIKHQSSASLAFVWEIHRGPVNFPHKGPVTRKMFPFDDVIMFWGIMINTENLIFPWCQLYNHRRHGMLSGPHNAVSPVTTKLLLWQPLLYSESSNVTILPQRAHGAIITSSFWCINDVIITPCVAGPRWEVQPLRTEGH